MYTATAQHGWQHWEARKHTNGCITTDCNRCKPCTPSVRGLHVEKIADSGAILHAFATGNEEQRLQQPSTVCTTEQLVHARVGASELAATCADHLSSPARGLQVAKIADGSDILQASAICSEEERRPQLPSTFGTSGQRDNARTAATEQAATSANSCASTVGSLQVAEVADSSVVSQVYANRSTGGDLQQLHSVVGTSGQAKNTQLGLLHTVAATSENLVSLSARSWQVAKVADML